MQEGLPPCFRQNMAGGEVFEEVPGEAVYVAPRGLAGVKTALFPVFCQVDLFRVVCGIAAVNGTSYAFVLALIIARRQLRLCRK